MHKNAFKAEDHKKCNLSLFLFKQKRKTVAGWNQKAQAQQ
jgi:hypothetical protein